MSPAAVVPAWPAGERSAFVAALAGLLNRPAEALMQEVDGDPIVAPPLWGRWHAAADRLDQAAGATPQWFHELNADPRLRVTAGLGAEVVRRNDEELMAQAWEQVDGVLAANEALRRAQAAREAAGKLLTKHLSTLDADTLLQVTAPVHARVLRRTSRSPRRSCYGGAPSRTVRPMAECAAPAGRRPAGRLDRAPGGRASRARRTGRRRRAAEPPEPAGAAHPTGRRRAEPEWW